MPETVILAYSGGVDTTACIPYLSHEYGLDVIAVLVDLGQDPQVEHLEALREKALKAGAFRALVVDAKEEFVGSYALPALKANALYEGKYPLMSALSRPLISQILVNVARETKATTVAHGATGKGNDQVRFESSIKALCPDLKVIAPAREWGFSRAEAIEYTETKCGIASHVPKESPYAIDLNLLGRNVEAGLLENLSMPPEEEVYALTRSLEQTPDHPEDLELEFEAGVPVALNQNQLSSVDMIQQLNHIAGNHGIGRVDMIESRLLGLKSREIYEAPALSVLMHAHIDLEMQTLPGHFLRLKRHLDSEYASLVYDGRWFDPLREALDAFMQKSQQTVSGVLHLRLFKGNIIVLSRNSQSSLYCQPLATYGGEDIFNHQMGAGFSHIYALSAQVWAQVQQSSKT